MNVKFIPGDSLGLLLPSFQQIPLAVSKRSRMQGLNNFCKVLKSLSLIEKEREISGLAYGLQLDGTAGLFIICKEQTSRVIGQVGPEKTGE